MTPRPWHVLLLGVALSACDRDDPPSEPPLAAQPSRAASPDRLASAFDDRDAAAPSEAPSAVPSAVPSAIVGLRERTLELAPRAAASERIAFGKDRVGQLRDDAFVVRSTGGGEIARIPVQRPRAVVELADGSLLAVDRDHTILLPAGSDKPEIKPRVTFFSDALVLADRRTSNQFWVLYPGGPSLYHYDLTKEASGLLAFAEFVDLRPKLGGVRSGAAVGLNDGSFALVAEKRVWRVFGSGHVDAMDPPEPERGVTRLLVAARLSEIWALRGDRVAERLTLTPRMHRVGKIALDPLPFDVATSRRYVAVVHLEQAAGEPKRFSLRVYDPDGKAVFERPLPEPSGFDARGEDWADRVTRNDGVALSTRAPLVAVGGPDRLQVWDLESGASVIDAQ